MGRDVLHRCNPIVGFLYFILVVVVIVVYMHPMVSGIAVATGLLYGIWLKGAKAIRFFLSFPLPIAIVTMIINGLFVHRGITVLWYFAGNPITKEAVVYGAAAGLMMTAVLLWFYAMSIIMTSDKFIYIFGKLLPSASLMFSMAMSFVPRFGTRAAKIRQSRKGLGCREASKMPEALKTISIMTTWALENSIDTADSMKARGYGRPGRSFFAPFSWRGSDVALLVLMTLAFAVVIAARIQFVCYPVISHQEPVIGILSVLVLCGMPMTINTAEEIRWAYLKSKI